MAKKKKKKNKYGKLMGGALALPLGATMVGALPQSAVTTNTLSGMSSMSKSFPIAGRIAGVGMTVRATSNVEKAIKKIK